MISAHLALKTASPVWTFHSHVPARVASMMFSSRWSSPSSSFSARFIRSRARTVASSSRGATGSLRKASAPSSNEMARSSDSR